MHTRAVCHAIPLNSVCGCGSGRVRLCSAHKLSPTVCASNSKAKENRHCKSERECVCVCVRAADCLDCVCSCCARRSRSRVVFDSYANGSVLHSFYQYMKIDSENTTSQYTHVYRCTYLWPCRALVLTSFFFFFFCFSVHAAR